MQDFCNIVILNFGLVYSDVLIYQDLQLMKTIKFHFIMDFIIGYLFIVIQYTECLYLFLAQLINFKTKIIFEIKL